MERNYYYFLDKEGHIWHEGTEVDDVRFAFLVNRTLQPAADGMYLVRCQNENCFFRVEDVPYVVQDLAFHKNEKGELHQIDLIFPGGYVEILDPATLRVGANNVLYCNVRKGSFDARFSRKAYFQLIPYLQEDSESHRYYIELNGLRRLIRQSVLAAGGS